jgi:hypothetical protein
MMDEKNKLFTTHLFIFMVGRRKVFNILDIHDTTIIFSIKSTRFRKFDWYKKR